MEIAVTFQRLGEVADAELKYAVVVSRYNGGWLLCRCNGRATWEVPGGTREPGEAIEETARRELFEETGAVDFSLTPLCTYGVNRDGGQSYGLLCFAQVARLGSLPPFETDAVAVHPTLPENLTYPAIQPKLFEWVISARELPI